MNTFPLPRPRSRPRVRPLPSLGLLAAMVIAGLTVAPTVEARTGAPGRLEQAETGSGNYLAAIMADARKDTAAAAHFFREALRSDPRNMELTERAFVASLADGGMPEAFRLAERLVQREQTHPLANLALGIRALRNRQFVTARTHLGRTGARGRNADFSSALLLAWTEVGNGDVRRALEIVDRFQDPQLEPHRNFFGGLMADVGGRKQDAQRRLKAAHAAEPSTIRFAEAFARFEARHGSRDEALRVVTAATTSPASVPFLAAVKRDLSSGRVPDPMVQNVAQGAAEVLYGAADIGRPGSEILSIVYLQLAAYLHPDNDLVQATLGEQFDQIDQHARAVEVLGRVSEEAGFKTRVVVRAAYALKQLEKTTEAIAALEARAAQVPDDLLVYDAIATIHRSDKRWAEAIAASTRAIERITAREPQHWNLFYGRGIAYERSKQWPLAEADFKTALSLLPAEPSTATDQRNKAQVLNYLAYSWVDMNMHLDEAFPMLRKAVDLQPRDGYIVDSLGWAYYKQGRYEDAVRELERAVDLKPTDPVINDHLGDAYWKVGRVLEARFQWNHARDLKPEPEELEKILRKIERGLEDVKPAAEAEARKPNGG